MNLTSKIKWVREHFSKMMTVKCPFFYAPTLPLMRILHPPQTFNKDRCNPQAETERVEAQNRKLLAENQKVMFHVALDILTDKEANLGKVSEKTQSVFLVEGKDRKHERDVKRDDEDAWREKKLMTRCL